MVLKVSGALDGLRPVGSDAKNPCGACTKAHSAALKADPIGTPEELECTYDDADEVNLASLKAKVQSLEAQIGIVRLFLLPPLTEVFIGSDKLMKELKVKEEALSRCTCGSTANGVSVSEPSTLPEQTASAPSSGNVRSDVSLPSELRPLDGPGSTPQAPASRGSSIDGVVIDGLGGLPDIVSDVDEPRREQFSMCHYL